MKTHSIAAATSGISFNGGARSARAALAGRTPCGPLGKRVRAMLRLACRVLGLKRRKGLGLALLGASGLALMGAAPAQAANGIHINANANGPCVSINDPQSAPSGGTDFNRYLQANVNFTDSTERCDSGRTNQKDSVLFYRPSGVSGVGATSLMLGGDLSVNSGYIKLGDDTTGQRIGDASTKAAGLGLAIGNGAEAAYRGISVGRSTRRYEKCC